VRDLAVLVLHLLTTIARLAGPGGARSVVAESVLLGSSCSSSIGRETGAESPPYRSRRRWRVCAPRAPEAAGPFGDCLEARHAPPPSSSAEDSKISPAVLGHSTAETGPAGTQPRCGGRRSRHETARSDVGMSTNRAADRLGLRHPHQQGCCRRILAATYRPGPDSAGPSWLTVLGHAKDSLWSLDLFRCESAVLRTHWVLVVMDQFTRRIVGFGVHRGVVDGVALCLMFNRATPGQTPPTYVSTDHDPLYGSTNGDGTCGSSTCQKSRPSRTRRSRIHVLNS
jgi:putative transposase